MSWKLKLIISQKHLFGELSFVYNYFIDTATCVSPWLVQCPEIPNNTINTRRTCMIFTSLSDRDVAALIQAIKEFLRNSDFAVPILGQYKDKKTVEDSWMALNISFILIKDGEPPSTVFISDSVRPISTWFVYASTDHAITIWTVLLSVSMIYMSINIMRTQGISSHMPIHWMQHRFPISKDCLKRSISLWSILSTTNWCNAPISMNI